MEVINKNISELTPYENNPRKNEAAVEYVANSIKEFGFKVPVVIDQNGVIIAGHTRVKAAELLGFETVPCIIADDLTEEQVKSFRLADNKTAELAEWDFDLLDIELGDICDIDMGNFGFDDLSVADGKSEIIEDKIPDIDKNSEPIARVGDVWQLGRHRLICGDAADAGVLSILMDGRCADLYITDPPYGVDYAGKTQDAMTIKNDSMGTEAFIDFLTEAFRAADAFIKPGGVFYIWHAGLRAYEFGSACINIGWDIRQVLIWVKNTMVLGRQDYQWQHEPCLYGWKGGAGHLWASDRKQTTVLNFDKPSRNGEHPTMKPVALFDYQIKNNTKGMDVVLDTFAGSGTTLIACEQNGRTCCASELDPKYCDVIIRRWENLTGEKAVLIDGEAEERNRQKSL